MSYLDYQAYLYGMTLSDQEVILNRNKHTHTLNILTYCRLQ